jgi:two-component system LytT family response regulator
MTSSDSFLGRVSSAAAAAQLPAGLIRKAMTEQRHPEQLIVRAGGKVVGLPVAAIEWIEADRNYVVLHANGVSHKVRETLRRIRTQPALTGFVQIHRSVLVNKAHVDHVCAHNTHDWEARLAGGTALKVGRRYLEQVRTHLRHKLQSQTPERNTA